MIDLLHKIKIGESVCLPREPKSESEIMARWGNTEHSFMPLVSIVCHTYNHVSYIGCALNGFLMQETDFPFEIIVHDDASADGTAEIIDFYASNYPNIIKPILQKENQWSKGRSPRGFSFPQVKGKYIALCEGDDFWICSLKLQEQVRCFKPGISLVFHDAIRIENEVVSDDGYYSSGSLPLNGYSSSQMVRGCKIPTASSMFLAEPFKNIEHKNVINGDHLIWATVGQVGEALFIPASKSAYRHHPGGVWSARAAIDKIEPALTSKLVIFEFVKPEFKTSALVGYVSICIELFSKVLEEEKKVNFSILRRMLEGVAKNLIQCKFVMVDNFKDLARIIKMIFVNLPLSIFRHYY